MGYWGLVVLVFTSFIAEARAKTVTFRAVGVSQEVLLTSNVQVVGKNLGALSEQVLTAAVASHVLQAFQASPEGILSINNLGNGLEVISKDAFNAYGWCYLIDGKPVDLLANEYQFTGNESLVEWYYGYDQLNGTQWAATCNPAEHLPPVQSPSYFFP